jgi:hypothetical protein
MLVLVMAGNVKLQPELLHSFQANAAEKLGLAAGSKPLFFVFHGGSGSEKKDIESGESRARSPQEPNDPRPKAPKNPTTLAQTIFPRARHATCSRVRRWHSTPPGAVPTPRHPRSPGVSHPSPHLPPPPPLVRAALSAGVVKMNVDTDTQWAYWEGILKFYKKNEGYLQGQIGNPDGPDKPNKDKYDPRKWVREAEITMCSRVGESCTDLKNV